MNEVLLHLTGQPYCEKSRSSKVKDEIINLVFRNYLIDQYTTTEYGINIIFIGFPMFLLSYPRNSIAFFVKICVRFVRVVSHNRDCWLYQHSGCLTYFDPDLIRSNGHCGHRGPVL
jgi:hypothetical protein